MTISIPRGRRSGLGRLLPRLLLTTALVAASAAYVWEERNQPQAEDAAETLPAPILELVAGLAPLYRDGSYRGTTENAYYGPLAVRVTITNGHLVAVKAVKFPKSTKVSARINKEALPKLEMQAVVGQSFDVHAVTGATFTSKAYATSLKAALEQAQKG